MKFLSLSENPAYRL